MFLRLQGGSGSNKGAWSGSEVTPIRVVGILSMTMTFEWPRAAKLFPQLPARCPHPSQKPSIAGLGLTIFRKQGAHKEPSHAIAASCPSSCDAAASLADAQRM